MLLKAMESYLTSLNEQIAEREALAAESRRTLRMVRAQLGLDPPSLARDVVELELDLAGLQIRRARAQRVRIAAALGVRDVLRPRAA
jgi:hypothetical protein